MEEADVLSIVLSKADRVKREGGCLSRRVAGRGRGSKGAGGELRSIE